MEKGQLVNLNSILTEPKERTFTDRTETMDLLREAHCQLNENEINYHNIINIHGIGGSGKSRVISEFIKENIPEPIFLFLLK